MACPAPGHEVTLRQGQDSRLCASPTPILGTQRVVLPSPAPWDSLDSVSGSCLEAHLLGWWGFPGAVPLACLGSDDHGGDCTLTQVLSPEE